MLKTKNNTIINSKGAEVFLHGVNLGGWLMMEGYILHGRNIAERIFKAEFKKHCGQKELGNFTKLYRNNFITEADFKNISSLGFNCVRLPFNYRLIEEADGLKILKKAVRLCEKYKIYCILDMHAAPGSQNEDWHSDSEGEAGLWKNKKYQEHYFTLWEGLAENFKNEETVAGYDILNESVIKKDGKNILRPFYKKAVKRIRAIDKKHIIFLEGNLWGQRLEDIGEPFADNLSYSVHFYHPLEFTFNFYRGLKYPGDILGEYWDVDTIRKQLKGYYNYSKKWNTPIFAGEFGVTSRYPAGCCGELAWVKDTLKCFKEFGFHWTYWTYKAVANSAFPDGIYQYLGNPLWVNRQGPVYGFENFYALWKKCKKEIIESWKTKNFSENKALSNLLASFKAI